MDIKHIPNYLTQPEQQELLELVLECDRTSPFYRPVMWNGHSFRFQITSCGELGWHSDTSGYRYQKLHPTTNQPWFKMPQAISSRAIELAASVGWANFKPESCLILLYRDFEQNGKARKTQLGLHKDTTERCLAPIISLSLGNTAVFNQGGKKRTDPTQSILLASGDALVTYGESRLAYHGVSRVIEDTSQLIPGGGRINLTIRQVNR
jgi:alkylated DNA repair protein (DNA oxidative demethylase)